jgi:hypothetical protein
LSSPANTLSTPTAQVRDLLDSGQAVILDVSGAHVRDAPAPLR